MARKTDIGSLNVRLVAITSQFNKGLGSARNTLKTFSRVMQTDVLAAAGRLTGVLTGGLVRAITSIPNLIGRAIFSLLSFAKVMAVTVVGAITAVSAALIYLTKSAFSRLDDVAKDARRIGITTKEFGGLALAASEAGIEIDKITTFFPKMQQSIGKATQGVGAGVKAFEDLGLSIDHLRSLSPVEQFRLISERIADVKNQTDRMRIAMDIFGRGAVEIMPLLTADFKEAEEAARILNLSLSEFDLAQIEAANDSVGRIKSAFEGLGNYLAVQLAPIITGLTQRIFEYIRGQGGIAAIASKVITSTALIVVDALNLIGQSMERVQKFADLIGVDRGTPSDAIQSIANGISGLTKLVIGFGATFRAVWASIKTAALSALTGAVGLVSTLIGMLDKVPGINIDMDAVNAFTESLAFETAEAAKEAGQAWNFIFGDSLFRLTSNVGQSIEELGGKAAKAIEPMGNAFADGFEKIKANLKDLTFDDLKAMFEELSAFVPAPIEEHTGALIDLKMAARAYFEEWNMIGTGPSKHIEAMTQKIIEQKARVKEVTDFMRGAYERLGAGIADSLTRAITRGENLIDSLKNVFLDAIDQMLSALIQFTLFGNGPLGGSGGGGGLFGALFGGFGQQSAAAAGAQPAFQAASMQEMQPMPAFAGAGMMGVQPVTNFNFYGPVAGEEAFRRIVFDSMRDKRGQSIIKDTSYLNTSSRLRREVAPLGGR